MEMFVNLLNSTIEDPVALVVINIFILALFVTLLLGMGGILWTVFKSRDKSATAVVVASVLATTSLMIGATLFSDSVITFTLLVYVVPLALIYGAVWYLMRTRRSVNEVVCGT